MASNYPSRSIIMYSGGRDSSLAACLELAAGRAVDLVTVQTGAVIPSEIRNYRTMELRHAFADASISEARVKAHGIFRRIALENLESDFKAYETNLILLGHQLAMQCATIVYARQTGATCVVSGFSGYQSAMYMEQDESAVAISTLLFAESGIEFKAPILDYRSLDEVKYRLLDFGVTTKSLEEVSLFADSFSQPQPGAIEGYLNEKLEIARDYIALRTSALAE
ncbi:hypothetical protein VV02_24050 [Luteipulveratus mongoliensis]|uniref:Asparagine synthetase domain-containing protein n=2 Tax=Luteipulveratus mongoliensis TaxID=571913 RepID=A0A0K1JRU0_9MICO|nr:hypothetical protein VV02_24050 [Luteipulveratus mongoliensis]